MTKEALKLALEFIERVNKDGWILADFEPQMYEAITAIKEALAQPEQEPVLWMMPDGNTADKWALQFYGGQKGKPLYTAPPQRTERPVDCERCNRLEEHAYDLVGELRVANIKLSMRPPRTWVGLTDEDVQEVERWVEFKEEGSDRIQTPKLIRYIEAKLKEKNGF